MNVFTKEQYGRTSTNHPVDKLVIKHATSHAAECDDKACLAFTKRCYMESLVEIPRNEASLSRSKVGFRVDSPLLMSVPFSDRSIPDQLE